MPQRECEGLAHCEETAEGSGREGLGCLSHVASLCHDLMWQSWRQGLTAIPTSRAPKVPARSKACGSATVVFPPSMALSRPQDRIWGPPVFKALGSQTSAPTAPSHPTSALCGSAVREYLSSLALLGLCQLFLPHPSIPFSTPVPSWKALLTPRAVLGLLPYRQGLELPRPAQEDKRARPRALG